MRICVCCRTDQDVHLYRGRKNGVYLCTPCASAIAQRVAKLELEK